MRFCVEANDENAAKFVACEWMSRELGLMWSLARDYAQQHGREVPTLADIERADRSACGHVDYAAKFAFYVADLVRRTKA